MKNNSFITPFNGTRPEINDQVYIDISARLIGNIKICRGASVWPGAVLRADDESIL